MMADDQIPRPVWADEATNNADAAILGHKQTWVYSLKPMLDQLQAEFGLDLPSVMLYLLLDRVARLQQTYAALYDLQKDYAPAMKRLLEREARELDEDEKWKDPDPNIEPPPFEERG